MTGTTGRTALPILPTLGQPARFHRLRFIEAGGDPAGTPGVPAADPEPVEPTPAQETDWKAEARKWEQRSKANADAAAELAALKAAQMTEAEKVAAERDTYKAELSSYKQREQVAQWSAEIVAGTAVPAGALRGSTREELEEHFAQLKALIPAPQQSQQPTAQPVPTIGHTPATPSGNVSLKDQIAAAEKAGDRALVGALKAMQLSTT